MYKIIHRVYVRIYNLSIKNGERNLKSTILIYYIFQNIQCDRILLIGDSIIKC